MAHVPKEKEMSEKGGKNKAAVPGSLRPSVWEAKINPGNHSTLRPVLETAEQHPIFT